MQLRLGFLSTVRAVLLPSVIKVVKVRAIAKATDLLEGIYIERERERISHRIQDAPLSTWAKICGVFVVVIV